MTAFAPLAELSIGDAFTRRDLPAGFLVATPGAARDRVFLVESGRLRIYLAREGRAQTLIYLEPGDIYATHTPTYIETVAPTVLHEVATSDFARRMCDSPAAVGRVVRVLGRLLERTVTLVEDLALHDVPSRLARFLVRLAERRGKAGDGGIRIALDLGTEDIASLLGTTRQTVSTLLNQWVREGLIRRDGRRVLTVLSVARLRQLAEGEVPATVGRPTDRAGPG
ncbi:MAG: Crp/Fnr family transcriptional regulator [Rhodocyclaceae bacterium]|nr:Crp/Fnr family transcriptional regulator [Rhodocyclaceae bacterium]